MEQEQLLFTSAAVLDLLSSIDELADKDIHLSENDNNVTIQIGESEYAIADRNAVDVEVPPEVVVEVDEITSDAFEELSADGVDVDLDDDTYADEVVEGGPIKQIAKTLLLGGMLRLSAKLLQKNK